MNTRVPKWSETNADHHKIWKPYRLPGRAISSCDSKNISQAILVNGPFLNLQDRPGASEWKAIILKCDQLHALCLPLTWLHHSCGGHMSELSRKLMVGDNLPDCFGSRHMDAILSELAIFVPTCAFQTLQRPDFLKNAVSTAVHSTNEQISSLMVSDDI